MRATLEEECVHDEQRLKGRSASPPKGGGGRRASLEEECVASPEKFAPGGCSRPAPPGVGGVLSSSANWARRNSTAGIFPWSASVDRTEAQNPRAPSGEAERKARIMRRFGPKLGERRRTTAAERIESLFAHERNCLDDIRAGWEDVEYFDETSGQWVALKRDFDFSDDMYLRLARFCNFDSDEALRYMEEIEPRYVSLKCDKQLEVQLRTQTLFPTPGLQTNSGLDVFYMRPNRYVPKQTNVSVIIDNLVYVMETMHEHNEKCCTDGIAFMANMAGWTRENFCVKYCFEFMKALQGQTLPVRVKLFLIVDPPSWFGVIWNVMLQMLSMGFAKRVRIVSSGNLDKYLQPGYREYLPDDMINIGKSNTEEMVSDFIAYRKMAEQEKRAEDRLVEPPHRTTSALSSHSSQSCRF